MSKEIFYPNPDSIWPGEEFFVCRENRSQEFVVQSELTADRAQLSVDALNEHEKNNARIESYFWRKKRAGEPTGKKAALL